MSRWKGHTFDVFVGNLPGYVDKGYVEHMFKSCGEIASVYVRNGRSSGSKIATVRFFCEPDAIKAVERYKYLTLDGNTLDVKLYPPKNKNNSSSVKHLSNNTNGILGNSNTSFIAPGFGSQVFNKKQHAEEIMTAVCHVESPVAFYGQRVSNLVEIATIANKLQSFCSSFVSVEGIPRINQIYAARFSQDQLWYRCRIVRVEMTRCFVFYIDYGNEEYVNNKDIVILPDDLAKIPAQSSLFVFKDLMPVSKDQNRDVYEKAVSYMKKLTNQTVQLRTAFCTENFFVIDKCMFQNLDVYAVLQKEGYATRVPSLNARAGPSQKNVTTLAHDGKNEAVSPTSKAISPQNPSHKANSRNVKPSSKLDHALKSASMFKKPTSKHLSKELCVEMEKVKSQNNKLTEELALAKERTKALKQELDALKTKPEIHNFEKLDCLILKTRQLFVIRNQHHAFEGCGSLTEVHNAINTELPSNVQASHEIADLHQRIENVLSQYHELLDKIANCEKTDLLSEHTRSRDEACKTACDLMKEYLESWSDDYLTELAANLQELLLETKMKYGVFLKANVSCNEKSLQELLKEYEECMMKEKSSSESLVKNTNDALSRFSCIIEDLQKDIAIPSDETKEIGSTCAKFTTTAFMDCFKEVQEAVDTEIISRSTQLRPPLNETLMASIVQILIKKIETPLEATLQEIEGRRKYNLLYPELCNCLKMKPDTTRICELRKEMKKLKSKLRHKLADKKDLEENEDGDDTSALNEINSSLDLLLYELHTCFKEEHDEMMKLVDAYKAHFRELDIENPDLSLSAYSKCNGIVKENWELEHFNYQSIAKRPEICYSAKFSEESVIIKEFHLSCDEYNHFLDKVMKWSNLKNDNIVPVHAVFKSKVGFQTYAVLPCNMTLEDLEKESPLSHHNAGQILCGVLKGLEYIHSQGLLHSLLSPSTVLIKSGSQACISLLDFNFGLSHSTTVWESKGIKFCPPDKDLSQEGDMYNFGCLILWVLFPNLHFTSTSDGVVDITGYKSIVQGLLSSSCFEAVESLLSAEPSARPTAKSLLEKNIFVELMHNSSDDDKATQASTPGSQNSEIPLVVSAASEETSDGKTVFDR